MQKWQHGDELTEDPKTGELRKAKKGENSVWTLIQEGRLKQPEECEWVAGELIPKGATAKIDDAGRVVRRDSVEWVPFAEAVVDIPAGSRVEYNTRNGQLRIVT